MTESKKPRGFAAMKAAGREDEIRLIAQRGGQRAHEMGRAHKYQAGDPRVVEWGRKGGLAQGQRRREREAAVGGGEEVAS